jgi:hypothetical protein
MEMIVTLIRLVYHDAASIRLKLEVADVRFIFKSAFDLYIKTCNDA